MGCVIDVTIFQNIFLNPGLLLQWNPSVVVTDHPGLGTTKSGRYREVTY